MERRASWIWRDRSGASGRRIDDALDSNLFAQFRRAFELTAIPDEASLIISADGRYKLFVNGAFVGRGPARCDPLFQYYDTYDIAEHLMPGANTIAVLVHSYGRSMSWYERPNSSWSRAFGCGGLYVEGDATAGDDTVLFDTDATWTYAVSEAWERDTPPGAVGFVEVYDARKTDEGWTRAGFDGSNWSPALVQAAPGIGLAPEAVPFPAMVERDIPYMFEEPRDGVRIASIGEVPAATRDLVELADARLQKPRSCKVSSPEAMLQAEGWCEVILKGERAAVVVIDFGRDVAGYPRLDLEGPAGATIDICYSETLRDDGRTVVQRANPVTSQNTHRYVLRDGTQTWEKFERAGLRYLQLTIAAPPHTDEATVRIHRAHVNCTGYPVEPRGAFACSDETLTALWQAGAYTLQLCMHDGFEDCPTREQRQWVGDAWVQSLVNYAAFGDGRLTAKLIRQVAQSQHRDGMTQMATPSDMSAHWPLYIVDYCLAWMMTAADHVLHTGDASAASDAFPSIARAVAWFERHVGEDGLLVEPPGWIFVDWAEVDRRGASGALNALFVQAARAAAGIADGEGARKLGRRWRAMADRAAAAVDEMFWDEERGAYVDALLPDGPGRRISQHTNAAIVAAGIAPRDRAERAMEYVMAKSRLVETTSSMYTAGEPVTFDEERDVVLAQPYFQHIVHRALVALGRTEDVISNIRERWGPMLGDEGTGTFWEHWHGRESRCHAWSATPVYDLSREVLGVRPTAPGFRQFQAAPEPCDLAWARGVWPSVRGDIPVSWRREGGKFLLELTVPKRSEGEVVLPPGAKSPRVNGAPARAIGDLTGRLRVGGLTPGYWQIEARLPDAR